MQAPRRWRLWRVLSSPPQLPAMADFLARSKSSKRACPGTPRDRLSALCLKGRPRAIDLCLDGPFGAIIAADGLARAARQGCRAYCAQPAFAPALTTLRRDFLPRGTGIVTRRPMVLQLYNVPAAPAMDRARRELRLLRSTPSLSQGAHVEGQQCDCSACQHRHDDAAAVPSGAPLPAPKALSCPGWRMDPHS